MATSDGHSFKSFGVYTIVSIGVLWYLIYALQTLFHGYSIGIKHDDSHMYVFVLLQTLVILSYGVRGHGTTQFRMVTTIRDRFGHAIRKIQHNTVYINNLQYAVSCSVLSLGGLYIVFTSPDGIYGTRLWWTGIYSIGAQLIYAIIIFIRFRMSIWNIRVKYRERGSAFVEHAHNGVRIHVDDPRKPGDQYSKTPVASIPVSIKKNMPAYRLKPPEQSVPIGMPAVEQTPEPVDEEKSDPKSPDYKAPTVTGVEPPPPPSPPSPSPTSLDYLDIIDTMTRRHGRQTALGELPNADDLV